MTRQERIKQLQERVQIAKDLIEFLKDQDQTEEMKALNTWLNQEILMAELSVTMVSQQAGWRC
jgi:hypothetical protein